MADDERPIGRGLLVRPPFAESRSAGRGAPVGLSSLLDALVAAMFLDRREARWQATIARRATRTFGHVGRSGYAVTACWASNSA